MIAASNLVAVGAPIAVIILAHREGLGGFRIGLFIALQGVALLAGSTVSPLLRRILPMRAILLSEFWMALVYGAFLVYPSVYVLAACAALHAFWFPNTDSAIAAYSYALIPDRLLGLVAERRFREIRVRVDRAGRGRGERLVERLASDVGLDDFRERRRVLE